MLYISRIESGGRKGYEVYGVVDTDDDTETLVSAEEISSAIFDHNLEIKGVDIVHDRGMTYIGAIHIYLDDFWCSRFQLKTKVLKGVDIRTVHGDITYVSANGKLTTGDVDIRLSDYGKRISWHSQIEYINHKGDNKLFLILDDKIEVVGSTPRISIPWIRFDIQDVTNNALVRAIYKDLIRMQWYNEDGFVHFIKDLPERNAYWKARIPAK